MKNACSMLALALAAAGCTGTGGGNVGCFDDTDCLSGEFCDVDGFCVPVGCFDDADCLAGELCAADGVCVVDSTYEACATVADCTDPFDDCWEVDLPEEGTFGSFCTNECLTDADCQPSGAWGGVCYAIEADPIFLCYQQCDFDADCFVGNVCVEVAIAADVVDFICVPNN